MPHVDRCPVPPHRRARRCRPAWPLPRAGCWRCRGTRGRCWATMMRGGRCAWSPRRRPSSSCRRCVGGCACVECAWVLGSVGPWVGERARMRVESTPWVCVRSGRLRKAGCVRHLLRACTRCRTQVSNTYEYDDDTGMLKAPGACAWPALRGCVPCAGVVEWGGNTPFVVRNGCVCRVRGGPLSRPPALCAAPRAHAPRTPRPPAAPPQALCWPAAAPPTAPRTSTSRTWPRAASTGWTSQVRGASWNVCS